jgi:septal ring factor EnvC (AmiA/AmiB activator)
MHPTHNETPATTLDNPPAPLDPRVLAALRAAVMVLVQEQRQQERLAPPAPAKDEKKEKRPEDSMPLFWRLCSASLVGVATLVTVTLYNQLSTSNAQVRTDLGQVRGDINQLRNDLVTRDEYNGRIEKTIGDLKALQTDQKKSTEHGREMLAEQKNDAAELRLEIRQLERDLQNLRERLSVLEQVQREASRPPDKADGKNP